MGSPAWAAAEDYLLATADAARSATGPILECGSGVTTLLLAMYAGQRGITVWSLEHKGRWAENTKRALHSAQVSANVALVPLRDYGEFTWYAVPPGLPSGFDLVICDGPPGALSEGRYGLIPVLGDALASSVIILVDDADRPRERAALERWRAQGMAIEMVSADRPYARVTRA